MFNGEDLLSSSFRFCEVFFFSWHKHQHLLRSLVAWPATGQQKNLAFYYWGKNNGQQQQQQQQQ